MKLKVLTLSSLLMLLSSCYGGYGAQAVGTMVGADVGGHIGGMIGGRMGGWTGDVFGTILGTAAGAAIGHAATTPPQEEKVVVIREQPEKEYERGDYRSYRGYDATTEQREPSYRQNRGTSGSSVRESSNVLQGLTVKNLRFVDAGKNRIINSNETCQLLFEVQNDGEYTAFNITPLVYEVNKMKHIYISSPAVINSLKPGEYVTYTITIRSDNKLTNGTATFAIELSDENGITVPCREFDITTQR